MQDEEKGYFLNIYIFSFFFLQHIALTNFPNRQIQGDFGFYRCPRRLIKPQYNIAAPVLGWLGF